MTKRFRNALLVLFPVLVLTSCGGGGAGSNPSGGISGNVTAPQGGDVQGAILAACPVSGNQFNCRGDIRAVQVDTSGQSAPYNIAGVTAGSYVVLAIKDVNKDNDATDPEDYIGYSLDSQNRIAAVNAPASGVNIRLFRRSELARSSPESLWEIRSRVEE